MIFFKLYQLLHQWGTEFAEEFSTYLIAWHPEVSNIG